MFTSTTAPGVVFESRAALAEHYQSDWHKYNLKRRQAGLPFLLQADFEARLAAAQALRAEKERAAQAAGRAHLKDKSKKKKKDKNKKNQSTDETTTNGGVVNKVSQCAAYDSIKEQVQAQTNEKQSNDQGSSETPIDEQDKEGNEMNVVEENGNDVEMKQEGQDDEKEEINPCQSLFDRHVSQSVEENIQYMQEKYGFFIPDAEYLQDAEGLIGYCHEKVALGRLCLYCHQCYPKSTLAIQSHMRDAQHCKLKYESGIDLEDLLVFYDFSASNQEFLRGGRRGRGRSSANAMEEENDEDEEEDGWEDMSDDEEEEGGDDVEDEDDDDYYNDLQEEVQRMGWNVTALGELVFPDGRIIGHRALNRYYKQRSSYRPQKASVAAAQQASRERLYEGRVVQLPTGAAGAGATSAMVASTRQSKMAGIPTSLAMGRGGKGILVPSAGTGAFTQVSLYRFRAVLRKQKRDEHQARKLKNRTAQNMNRMDKKANRLMNDVSVAHAKR